MEVAKPSEDIRKAINSAVLGHPVIRKNVGANSMALPEVELVSEGTLVRLTRAKKLVMDER